MHAARPRERFNKLRERPRQRPPTPIWAQLAGAAPSTRPPRRLLLSLRD